MLWTFSMKKGFIPISFLQFTKKKKKKIGRSGYDVNFTYFDVIPILFFLKIRS